MGYDLDRMRALNPLSAELDRYGISVDRKGFARCPFHGEKTASFRVYPDGTFHCFGCGAHGDVITFVMKMQNISFLDACAKLDGEVSYSEQRKINKIKREREKQAEKRDNAVEEYFNALDLFEANEQIIKDMKPKSATDTPDGVWLYALNMRSLLEYYLEVAETEYIKGGS